MLDTIKQYEGKLATANSPNEVIDYSNTFLLPTPPYINYHIQLMYSSGNINKLLSNASSGRLEISLTNKKIYGYRFQLKKKNRNFIGSFFVRESSVKNLFQLHSICFSTSWNEFISYLTDHQYPKLVSLYIKQDDLTRELRLFEERNKKTYKLVVTELLIREKRSTQNPNGRSSKRNSIIRYASIREWFSQSISEVLTNALEKEQYFKKVKIQFQAIHKEKPVTVPIANCSLTKTGAIFFNNLYHTIAPLLLEQLEPSLENSIKLFMNRGLMQRNYEPAKPLAIEYGTSVFGDVAQLKTFKDLMASYPNSSKAVYHANPYFHANIADYKDGSSFDVFISNPYRVLIIPQLKTSVPALERIVSYIFSNYREGTVIEMR